MSDERVKHLLGQAYKLLKMQDDSGYVLNLLESQVVYDGATCDGHCLMNDIADALNIETN